MSTLNLVNIRGVALTEDFHSFIKEFEAFEPRNEDVWVTAFPKSGCTWTQEMIWLIANNLDYEGAKSTLGLRFPYIEFGGIKKEISKFIVNHKIPNNFAASAPDCLELLKEREGVRFIKTHLPWDFLPQEIQIGNITPKIIHVMRNPKQIVPSYYHHSKAVFPMYAGNLNDFVDLYIQGRLLYGDYFRTVLSYWKEKHRQNLLILTYEEMRSDLLGVLKKVSRFLGKSYSKDELKNLEHHLSFNQMKQNPAVNFQRIIKDESRPFIRKGEIDSYKEELSTEMINKLDQWINKRIEGTGLPYEELKENCNMNRQAVSLVFKTAN